MSWQTVVPLVVGAFIGFLGAILLEYVKRRWEKRDRRKRGQQCLSSLFEEIEEGIKRSQMLVEILTQKEEVSFSRIYISFWESTMLELIHSIEDLEVLRLLHSIYYRFDLINFNMERDRLGVGAAFAKRYLSEIEDNFAKLKERAHVLA